MARRAACQLAEGSGPELPADRKARTERLLSRRLRSCGCHTGAAFVLAGVLALAARATTSGLDGSGSVRGIVALFGLALPGKAVGLIAAETSLRRTLRRLVTAA